MNKKPTLAIERPTKAATSASKAAAKLAADGTIRLVLELAPATRHAIKVRAVQQGKTIKGYLLALAAADGVDVQERTD